VASIDRVKKPSDFPDYQPTHFHKGSIPSTLVAQSGCLSIICFEILNPMRDPAMFKSWSLRIVHLFVLSWVREKE